MWYFTIKQNDLKPAEYQALQKLATLTEVEPFNEPYDNLCLFTVENYAQFVDALDLAAIQYNVTNQRPTRDKLLDELRG